MLRRIHIKGYKSLDDLDVSLEPLSIIFGPNAAGKSNFLDALQLMARFATGRNLKEAFEKPYRGSPTESFYFQDEVPGPSSDAKSLRMSFEADIALSEHVVKRVEKECREYRSEDRKQKSFVKERYLRYELEIEVRPASALLRVVNEQLSALTQDGKLKTRKPFLSKDEGSEQFVLRMEKQSHPLILEAGLDHTILSRPLYAPHHPHMLAAKYEFASWVFFYFEPRERMRASNPVREVSQIGLMGDDLSAYLHTTKTHRPKQFAAIERAVRAVIPQISRIDTRINAIGEVELVVVEGKRKLPARLLSEGTLRLLGLFAAGSSEYPPGLIGLEEPENGINPRRVQFVGTYLAARTRQPRTQIVATTHSPVLLDQVPSSSLFLAKRKNDRTEICKIVLWGELERGASVRKELDAGDENVRVSERILAGEFDV